MAACAGHRPDDIIIGGDSAGGGLALSLLLALRAAGKPLPKAAVLMAPWTDLTVSSPSYETPAPSIRSSRGRICAKRGSGMRGRAIRPTRWPRRCLPISAACRRC